MPPSSAQAYNSLTAFKPREAKDVMGEAETKYDIAGQKDRLSSLRGLVSNLSSSVEAVDPSVTGRTSGTFTTEGQRQALVSRERQPILNDLGKQQQALGIQQQGFSESQNLATQMASALISQDQQTYQRLLDQYNVAKQSEAVAEEQRRAEESKRQWEATMAENRRQFDAQLAESKRAAQASAARNFNLSNPTPKASSGQSAEDAKYQAYIKAQQAKEQQIIQQMSSNKGLKILSGGGTNGLSVLGKGSLPLPVTNPSYKVKL